MAVIAAFCLRTACSFFEGSKFVAAVPKGGGGVLMSQAALPLHIRTLLMTTAKLEFALPQSLPVLMSTELFETPGPQSHALKCPCLPKALVLAHAPLSVAGKLILETVYAGRLTTPTRLPPKRCGESVDGSSLGRLRTRVEHEPCWHWKTCMSASCFRTCHHRSWKMPKKLPPHRPSHENEA